VAAWTGAASETPPLVAYRAALWSSFAVLALAWWHFAAAPRGRPARRRPARRRSATVR